MICQLSWNVLHFKHNFNNNNNNNDDDDDDNDNNNNNNNVMRYAQTSWGVCSVSF
jgi:hypothetical protein